MQARTEGMSMLADSRIHKVHIVTQSRAWQRGMLPAVVVLLLLFLAAGCATTDTPPPNGATDAPPAAAPTVLDAADVSPVPESPETLEALPGPVPPGSAPALPPERMRRVGIVYSTWFPPQVWDRAWSRPDLGEYDSADPYIIAQHADWLYAADVDFIFIDWSNNIRAHEQPILRQIEDATDVVFQVYAELDERPQISIFLGIEGDPAHLDNGNLRRKADQIYTQYVSNPRYRPLMVHYLGKPLLVVYVSTPSPWQDGLPDWDDDRFTVRWMTGFMDDQPALRTEQGYSRHGFWSFWERAPQTVTMFDRQPESIAVTAAHPGYYGWGDKGNAGRSRGATFREQWDLARQFKPRFVIINSWNEWVPPEEMNPEWSNDLEPSQAHGYIYLELLANEIEEYRRVR